MIKKIILCYIIVFCTFFAIGCGKKSGQANDFALSPTLMPTETITENNASVTLSTSKNTTWETVAINDKDNIFSYNNSQYIVERLDYKKVKIQYSYDNGVTWASCSIIDCPSIIDCFMGFTPNQFGWLIINGDVGAGSQFHYIYITEDAGKTWSEVGNTNELGSHMLSGAGFSDKKVGFLNYIYQDGPTGFAKIHQTLDGGTTWEMLQLELPEQYVDCTAQALSPTFDGNKGVMPIEVVNEKIRETINCYSDDYGKTWNFDEPDIKTEQSDLIELKPLQTAELYEGGKIFLDIPEKNIKLFQDKVTAIKIPDARKGERATNILDEDWLSKGLLFLNSIPEKNIYLYGYNDEELYEFGLIWDIGEEQHIYSFPISYMTAHSIAPSISASEDGSKIFVSCLTGTGTGVSVSQLYVFQVSDDVEVFYVDINYLVELLNNKISMTYDTKNEIMTISSEGKQITADSLIGNDGIPEGFYCGKFISYEFNNDSVKVSCKPIINLKEQVGIDSYLAYVSLEADIKFEYDSNGKIIGFSIGEITAVDN